MEPAIEEQIELIELSDEDLDNVAGYGTQSRVTV